MPNQFSSSQWVEQINQRFQALFAGLPRVYFSPGRVNIIGEHVDYSGGYVVPAAIHQGVYLGLTLNDTDVYRIYSLDYNEQLEFTKEKLYKHYAWFDYLLGAVHLLHQKNLTIPGFDLMIGGDLPIGKGLSSSAAVECGLIFALNDLLDFHLSKKEMALLGQKVEWEFIGVQCGLMDQYANLFSQDGNCLFLDCETFEHELLALKNINQQILLFDSGHTHNLKNSEYNTRRQQAEAACALLSKIYRRAARYRNFSLAELEVVKDQFDPILYKRAHHILSEIERTLQAKIYLQQGQSTQLGKMLYFTHKSLSEDYEVSLPQLDYLVELAKKQPEILGARLMGGGFGGCTINLLKPGADLSFINPMLDTYQKIYPQGGYYLYQLGGGSQRIS